MTAEVTGLSGRPGEQTSGLENNLAGKAIRKLYGRHAGRFGLPDILPDREVEIISSCLIPAKGIVGMPIIVQGFRGNRMYIIVSGRASVTVRSNGSTKKIAELKEADVFGEMAIVNEASRIATVTPLENCDLLMLSGVDSREKIEKSCRFFPRLIRGIAEERKRED